MIFPQILAISKLNGNYFFLCIFLIAVATHRANWGSTWWLGGLGIFEFIQIVITAYGLVFIEEAFKAINFIYAYKFSTAHYRLGGVVCAAFGNQTLLMFTWRHFWISPFVDAREKINFHFSSFSHNVGCMRLNGYTKHIFSPSKSHQFHPINLWKSS